MNADYLVYNSLSREKISTLSNTRLKYWMRRFQKGKDICDRRIEGSNNEVVVSFYQRQAQNLVDQMNLIALELGERRLIGQAAPNS